MDNNVFYSFKAFRWVVPNHIWKKIALELSESKNIGRPRSDDRVILNAIVWKYKSRAPWRDMPSRFPPYTTVNTRFLEWQKTGKWRKILKILKKEKFPPLGKMKTIRIKSIKDEHWVILEEYLEMIYEVISKRIQWSPEEPEEYERKYLKEYPPKKIKWGKKVHTYLPNKYPYIQFRDYEFRKSKYREVSELTRKHLDGIIWQMQTGASWRDIPLRYGKWQSIFSCRRRWELAGMWKKIFNILRENGYIDHSKELKEKIIREKFQEIHNRQKSKGIIK